MRCLMSRCLAVDALLVSASIVGCLHAGAGSSLKMGDPAPGFTNLPAVDGKTYSLADFKQDLLVLCVTCNHCPVAAAYEKKRFIDFTAKYAGGKDAKVAFVAVCVSTMDVDNLDKMRSGPRIAVSISPISTTQRRSWASS